MNTNSTRFIRIVLLIALCGIVHAQEANRLPGVRRVASKMRADIKERNETFLARTNSYSLAELEAMGIQLRAREVLTLDYNPSPETEVMVVRRRWVLCSDPIEAPVFLVCPFNGPAFTNNVFIGSEQLRKMNVEDSQRRKDYQDQRRKLYLESRK